MRLPLFRRDACPFFRGLLPLFRGANVDRHPFCRGPSPYSGEMCAPSSGAHITTITTITLQVLRLHYYYYDYYYDYDYYYYYYCYYDYYYDYYDYYYYYEY